MDVIWITKGPDGRPLSTSSATAEGAREIASGLAETILMLGSTAPQAYKDNVGALFMPAAELAAIITADIRYSGKIFYGTGTDIIRAKIAHAFTLVLTYANWLQEAEIDMGPWGHVDWSTRADLSAFRSFGRGPTS